MSGILQKSVSTQSFRTISVLIVSSSFYANKLNESLKTAHEKLYKDHFKLLVVKANNVQDILDLKIPIDFIVFVVNTSSSVHVEQVKDDLNLLDKTFFIGRISIVNATNFLFNNYTKDLQTCTAEYNIPIINGDINKPNKYMLVGERILRLLDANLLKEIPFIPWIPLKI